MWHTGPNPIQWHYQNLRSGTVRKPKPVNQPRTDDWEEPTIGIGKTYEPPQPEPPKKKRGLWKPFLIAGIAIVLLCGLIFGVSLMNGMRLEYETAVPEETIADVKILQETVPIELESPPAFSYTYEKRKTGVTITGFEGEVPSEVEIPAEIDGLPVTRISGLAFIGCDSLKHITIPESVTAIGNKAFAKCTGLQNISIPNGVTAINEYTFQGCSNLSSVVIPQSVTSIGNSAFLECSSLSNITIPDSVTSIGDCAFSRCTNLSSVSIPEGVTCIGASSFVQCSSLSNITIPDSVTSIGDYAFYNCSSLSSITIPNGVTSIGGWTFYNCASLHSFTINRNCTAGIYAFPSTCQVYYY